MSTWIALIVDQDENLACSIAASIRVEGLEVRVATSLRGVLATVDAPGVDIVVANVELDGTCASALLRALRERDSDLPVVFVNEWPTSSSDDMDSLRAAVVTAVRHRIQRRTRRRSTSPQSHPVGVNR